MSMSTEGLNFYSLETRAAKNALQEDPACFNDILFDRHYLLNLRLLLKEQKSHR